MVAYSAELTTGVDGCPAYRAWFQNHAKTWAQVCDKGGYARAFSGYAEAFRRCPGSLGSLEH